MGWGIGKYREGGFAGRFLTQRRKGAKSTVHNGIGENVWPVGADFTGDGKIRAIVIVFRRDNHGDRRPICPMNNERIISHTGRDGGSESIDAG